MVGHHKGFEAVVQSTLDRRAEIRAAPFDLHKQGKGAPPEGTKSAVLGPSESATVWARYTPLRRAGHISTPAACLVRAFCPPSLSEAAARFGHCWLFHGPANRTQRRGCCAPFGGLGRG